MPTLIPYDFPGAAGPASLSDTVSTRPVVVLRHDLGGTRCGPSDLIPGLTAVYSTLKGAAHVVRNDRGELELFAPGSGDKLWTAREDAQSPAGSFTGWEQLPIPAEKVAATVLDDEGAVLVFVYTPGFKLDCYRRPPGGVWAQWALPDEPGLSLSQAIRDAESKGRGLGGDTRGNPFVGRLADGRLAVLALSTGRNIRQRTQTAPGLW